MEQLTFVGYDNETKGYHLWSAAKQCVMISSDVIFEESIFPHRKQLLPAVSKPIELTLIPVAIPDPDDPSEVIDIDIVDDNDNDDPSLPPALP